MYDVFKQFDDANFIPCLFMQHGDNPGAASMSITYHQHESHASKDAPAPATGKRSAGAGAGAAAGVAASCVPDGNHGDNLNPLNSQGMTNTGTEKAVKSTAYLFPVPFW